MIFRATGRQDREILPLSGVKKSDIKGIGHIPPGLSAPLGRGESKDHTELPRPPLGERVPEGRVRGRGSRCYMAPSRRDTPPAPTAIAP